MNLRNSFNQMYERTCVCIICLKNQIEGRAEDLETLLQNKVNLGWSARKWDNSLRRCLAREQNANQQESYNHVTPQWIEFAVDLTFYKFFWKQTAVGGGMRATTWQPCALATPPAPITYLAWEQAARAVHHRHEQELHLTGGASTTDRLEAKPSTDSNYTSRCRLVRRFRTQDRTGACFPASCC